MVLNIDFFLCEIVDRNYILVIDPGDRVYFLG